MTDAKDPEKQNESAQRPIARGKADIDKEALRLKKERLIAQKRALLAKKQAALKAAKERQAQDATRLKQDATQLKSANTQLKDATRVKAPNPNAPRPDATQFARPIKKRVEVGQNEDAKTVFKAPPTAKVDSELTDISLPLGASPGQVEVPQSRDMLKNRFILEDVIGAGGMGVVYKAKDLLKVEAQDRDPYVAIKVLGEEFKSHPEAFIALQRESRKTQRIAHPNIVNVHDFDKDGHTVFMTMEFLEGTPLDKLIKKYRATGLPPMDAWQILEGICSALEYAHNQSIIHSDLKPGNIFVTSQNIAKVFDFGIARAVASAEQSDAAALEDRTVFDAGTLGALTPAYASLEMLEGETPDIRDDVYALGCIAYELFTGQHPFDKKNAKDAQAEGLKPKRIDNITKQQWRAIEKALAFTREDRIDSVHAFWGSMQKVHRKPIAAWVLSVIVLAVGGGYAYYEMNKPEPVQQPQLSEEKFRNEIELKLRLELIQKNLNALLEDPVFDERWEEALWQEVNNLQALLGEQDSEVLSLKQNIVTLYVQQIEKELEANQLSLAQVHANNGQRYTSEAQPFGDLLATIGERLAEAQAAQQVAQAQASKQQQKQQAEKKAQQAKISQRNAFKLAMTNVDEQLACNRVLDMRDFAVAIDKMKSVSMTLYRQEESRIIESLAQCITKISRNFASRARTAKQEALVIFNNDQRIANIQFETVDGCNTAKAGLGARRRLSCEDVLAAGGKGPELVVVPAGKGFSAFAIGRFEVSNGDLALFCKATGSCSTSGNTAHPAASVPLKTAQQYAIWLSEQTGKAYRLPTEKEWHYAATSDRASSDSNRNCFMNSRGIQKGGAPIEVNGGQKNAWGLFNVVGNVREWVAPQRGGGAMALGGSFNTPMEDCTLASSTNIGPNGDSETGFRVLRELDD